MTAAAPITPTTTVRRREPGRVGPIWALYVLTLRQYLHGRRWMVMAALFVLPAVLAVVMRLTTPDVPGIGLEFMTAFMFIPQALLPLVGLMYASGMIQDEQEEQTITYLLVRPIPKWALYGVKLVATVTTVAVLSAAFTAVTYAAIYWGAGHGVPDVTTRCVKAVEITALSTAVYCCVFGLLSLLTNRALVVGIIYAGLVEGVFANLPFGIRLITVIYYARLIAYRSISFKFLNHGRPEDPAAEVWQLDVVNDPKLLEHPSVSTCLIILVVGGLACAAIGAFLCSRREFHVKTPEKN